MNIVDLGELHGPLLVFGGVHSNLQALQALQAIAKSQDIPPENMICTGDTVAYGADAAACATMVEATGITAIKGNVEAALAIKSDNCGCGFTPGSACDVLSIGWYAHANATLSPQNRNWMAGLPDRLVFQHFGRKYMVLHGAVDKISRFIWPVDQDGVFENQFAMAKDIDVILAGHSGMAFVKKLAGKEWINAGAIGLPAHDGSTNTRYVMLENGQATIHQLAYDHVQAQQQMQQAGLNGGYEKTLLSGYWPSEDILPQALRR